MKFWTLLLISCSWFTAYAQDLNYAQIQELETLINTDIGIDDPGMAVGVVRQGKVIYESFSGLALLDYSILIDAKTSFNIASCAKQFTALTILSLVEDGLLDLDTDFREYLSGYYSEVDHPITVANLLNHSSGIRDVYDLWGFLGKTWWAEAFANSDAWELIKKQRDLDFLPGTQHQYSNSNYLLLTAIVETVSGKKFDSYADSLFAGLGMSNTSFSTNSYDVVPARARPYGNWGSWKEYPMLADLHGDGALYTTISDQLHWESLLQTRNSDFLSAELLLQSQQPIPGQGIQQYGFGLEFGTFRGLDYRYHGGNTGAYNAMVYRFPSQELSIVVMSNSGAVNVSNIANQVAEIVCTTGSLKSVDYPTQPATISNADSLAELAGAYQLESGVIVKIVAEAGELYAAFHERERLHLLRVAGNLFEEDGYSDWKLAFDPESDNAPLVTYHPGVAPASWQRVNDQFTDYHFAALNGTYHNSELDRSIEIRFIAEDRYQLSLNGEAVGEGQLFLPDVLLFDDYRMTFIRDEEEQLLGFQAYISNRATKVWFSRVSSSASTN